MIPPTITGTSSMPDAFIAASTSGTSSMCDPDRIESPMQCTSSATAAATICSGVSPSATTDITSFCRAPDLYASSWAPM